MFRKFRAQNKKDYPPGKRSFAEFLDFAKKYGWILQSMHHNIRLFRHPPEHALFTIYIENGLVDEEYFARFLEFLREIGEL
jgi:hypothetical protein